MRYLLLSLVSVLFYSCISLKEIPKKEVLISLKSEGFKGIYFDRIDSNHFYSLADFLIPGYQAKFNHMIHGDTLICELSGRDTKSIELRIKRNGILEYKNQLKLNYKNGYYYLRPRYFNTITIGLYDLPVLQKVRFAKDIQGNLLLDAVLDWKNRRLRVPGSERIVYYQNQYKKY